MVARRSKLAFTNDGTDATFGCKVPEDDFAAVTSVDGITPAKYAARYHWISVEDPKVLPEAEALALLRGSYELVKSALSQKLRAQIDGTGSRTAPKKSAPKKLPTPKTKNAAAPKKRAAAIKK